MTDREFLQQLYQQTKARLAKVEQLRQEARDTQAWISVAFYRAHVQAERAHLATLKAHLEANP